MGRLVNPERFAASAYLGRVVKPEHEKDEINVPIALSAFRDGDQGPSKVTKTELKPEHFCSVCLYRKVS